MKTKKRTSRIINFLIFASLVSLGAGSGYYTGNYRVGIHIGIALGLIGIAAFKLHQEKLQKALQIKSIPHDH